MAQMNRWKTYYECDLTGYTLVIPSVAVGNVSQLACDLVISSLAMRKMALVYSPALIPVIGYDPYQLESTSIAGCCELYICERKKIAILLLRAPLVQKYSHQFLTEVVDKFKEEHVKDIIILTSSFAHEKKHIMTSPFRYAVNELYPYVDKLKSLKWVEHEPKEETVRILGGGFANLLFEIVKEKIPCIVIYKFSSEGDNIPDAYDMVQYLNSIVTLFDEPDIFTKLIHPPSWKLMYGGPPPSDIY